MKLTKQTTIDFIILCLRWYLAFYMIDYGWAKLTGGQFGAGNQANLDKPLKEVNQFYLTWYLFSQGKLFNIVVGSSQIIGAILIVINRTVVIGALTLLPILIQIFLIDAISTISMFGYALPIRLGCMVLSDLAILFYYKDRILLAWNTLTNGTVIKNKYPWWIYLLLPVIGFLLDFLFGLVTIPIRMLLH